MTRSLPSWNSASNRSSEGAEADPTARVTEPPGRKSPLHALVTESRKSPKQVKATITASIQYWDRVARR